jgi:hypothetical protein
VRVLVLRDDLDDVEARANHVLERLEHHAYCWHPWQNQR